MGSWALQQLRLPSCAAFNSPSRYTRILKHHQTSREEERLVFKAGTTDIGEASKEGIHISGPKKTSRRKKSEDTKPEKEESVIRERKTRRRRTRKDEELVLSESQGDFAVEQFLETQGKDMLVEENGKVTSFANNWPPLVCCFGAVQDKFTPISVRHIDPDIHATTEGLQCNPSDFVRARGGPPSNVAVKLARLGGRVAFMGKVGSDACGRETVITLNMNNVQTRGVQVDPSSSTSISYIKLKHEDGKLGMTCIKPSAEDSLVISDINVDILREARLFYFNSMPLLTKSMRSTLLAAIKFSKKCGGIIFFDVNLSLPLWRPHDDETWQIIQEVWSYSNVIEVSKQELEFLLDNNYVKKKTGIRGQYLAEADSDMQPLKYYHPTREQLLPLWHDDLKLLLVNDGPNLHYYTSSFDDVLPGGIEDVNYTGFIRDRSAGNDTFIAGIIKRLVMEPELYSHQLHLPKMIKHAISSGIAAQGIIPCIRNYATDSREYIMNMVYCHLSKCL